MSEIVSELNSGEFLRNISLYQFSFAMFFSLSMNLILAKCYQYFNTSYTNPSSTLKSIVLIGLIITLIMIIIGSNIARAFALVGAMSIVRFRNPLKDPKDLTFIFASIAIGMASGTFFYEYAIIFLIFFISANFIMHNLEFSKQGNNFRVLKIRYKKNDEKYLNDLLNSNIVNYKLINYSSFIESDNVYIDKVLEIKFKDINKFNKFSNDLTSNNKYELNILLGEQETGN
jgi:hypothetical protein|tara:strand:- start:380 stop:1069 length:690 start_codon:yes stop_codon:yes gene_type:complete